MAYPYYQQSKPSGYGIPPVRLAVCFVFKRSSSSLAATLCPTTCPIVPATGNVYVQLQLYSLNNPNFN